MTDPSWLDTFKSSLKSQSATWFVGLLMAILAGFSSPLTESIKSALNRADSRTHHYEELATEVGHYIFEAELIVDFIENGWATQETLPELIEDYNQSASTLRKKEFVNEAWVQKYWGEEQVIQYQNFMKVMRTAENALRALNDEIIAVGMAKTKSSTGSRRTRH